MPPPRKGFYKTLVGASNVAVAGNYAYVAALSGLHIIDVSLPSTPAKVGFIETPGSSPDVAVAGNYAYVADGLLVCASSM